MLPKQKNTGFLIIVGIVAYLMVVLFALHIGTSVELSPEEETIEHISMAIARIRSEPFSVSFTEKAVPFIGIASFIYIMAIMFMYSDALMKRRDAPNKENGSAKWNTDFKRYNKLFTSPFGKKEKDGDNIILSQRVFLGLNTRKTLRNLNCLINGGAGSGKSRFWVKPNGLQMNTSYIFTDPSGEILASLGTPLERAGYKIKVFNLVNMKHSNCYNPFHYIRDDLGVYTLINCLIKNTTPPGSSKGDPFWEASEKSLLSAIMFYLVKYRPKEEQNFASVMKYLRWAEIDENNSSVRSKLDLIFEQVEKTDPHSIALKQYRTFKLGSGKTLKSILISCATRLTVFNLQALEDLTCIDTIDLGTLGDEKQALFIIIPQADDTYNFLVSMMYSQLFETLYYHAENECYYFAQTKESKHCIATFEQKNDAEHFGKDIGTFSLTEENGKYTIEDSNHIYKQECLEELYAKKLFEELKQGIEIIQNPKEKALPVHVRCLMDEFANVGQVPEFDKKLSTMRKYEISCAIILQNLSQLKEIYDKKADSIIGNCDANIFLGGQEVETCEYYSKLLGEATIIGRNTSHSLGKKGNSSHSYSHSARKLMTLSEIRTMPNNKCLVFVRGEQPFYDTKYDYTKHPNYSLTGDADKSLLFRVHERFNNTNMKEHLKKAKPQAEKIRQEKVQEIAKEKGAKELISSPTSVEKMVQEERLTSEKEVKEKFISRKNIRQTEEELEEWNFDSVKLPEKK